MRILIVDDEALVRIGIRSCVDWEEYGIEVVGEAEDGVTALDQIEKLTPDVVLLDIKMPRMDGLEVLKEIKNKGIQCHVIMLSSFDDFDYVREAMKNGAIDYLHKPRMNAEGILSVLLNLSQSLEQKTTGIHVQETTDKVDIIHHLQNPNLTKKQFEEICIQNHLKFEKGYFSILSFGVKKYKQVLERYERSQKNVFHHSVFHLLSNVFSGEKGVEFFQEKENRYIIIFSNGQEISQIKILSKAHEIIALVEDAMKKFLNVEIVFGVSDIFLSYSDFSNAFDQAIKALETKFYHPNKTVIFFRDFKIQIPREKVLKDAKKYISAIKERAKNYNYDAMKEETKSLIQYIQNTESLEEEEVKKLLEGVLFLVDESPLYLKKIERLNECETLQTLMENFFEMFNKAIETKQIIYQYYPQSNYLVKKIIEHINEYYNQEISLAILSEKFEVSPAYISRLFKKETGQGLFDYINEVRVERSKILLLETQLKVYEVAEKVGFKSPVHYSIVFNKYTGMSPKQYQNAM